VCTGIHYEYQVNLNERDTMNTTLKTTEIAEAAQVFVESGCDANAMRSLMDLLQEQTEYVQKRFWKLVDAQR